jgi:hypothetical protein
MQSQRVRVELMLLLECSELDYSLYCWIYLTGARVELMLLLECSEEVMLLRLVKHATTYFTTTYFTTYFTTGTRGVHAASGVQRRSYAAAAGELALLQLLYYLLYYGYFTTCLTTCFTLPADVDAAAASVLRRYCLHYYPLTLLLTLLLAYR